MQRCTFCGSEFPNDARFCGQCGRVPNATLDAPMILSSGEVRPVPKQAAEEEEERRRALLLDLSFPQGGGGQPGAGQVPVAQGSPQVSGVPVVQGIPQTNGAAAVSAVSSSAATSAPSSPGPPQVTQNGASMAPTASSAKPSPVKPPHSLQEPPHHVRQGLHSPGKHHVSYSAGSVSARAIGSAHKWLFIGLGIIVAGGIALAVVRLHPPAGETRTQAPIKSGSVTTFSVPTAGSTLLAITAGPDGSVWFTEYHGNKIGRITPGGVISEFPLPTGTSGFEGSTAGPSGITAGSDGNLWFTEYFGNKIGRITPGSPGSIIEFVIQTADSGPSDITAGPDGNLWFTQHNGMIGRITPSGTISEFPLSTANSSPAAITVGPAGTLWFIESNGDKIGRIGAG